jgi:hypothetical protein
MIREATPVARFASAPGLAFAPAFGGDLDLVADVRGLLARDVSLAFRVAMLSVIIRFLEQLTSSSWPWLQLGQELYKSAVFCGFDHVVIKASFSAAPLVFFLTPASQSDQHDVLAPRLFANPTGYFVAVEFRHSNIQERNFRTDLLGYVECFQTVIGQVRLLSDGLEQYRK